MRDEYIEDIIRIKKIFEERGYYISLNIASDLWEEYSESLCAGWIYLPKNDDEVFSCLQLDLCPHCKKILYKTPIRGIETEE